MIIHKVARREKFYIHEFDLVMMNFALSAFDIFLRLMKSYHIDDVKFWYNQQMHARLYLYFVWYPFKKKRNSIDRRIYYFTYKSVPLGNKVPSSLIRSLILNRRRRSTKKYKIIYWILFMIFYLLILWLSFFCRSRTTRRSSSSVNGKPILAFALRILVGHDDERNTEVLWSPVFVVDNYKKKWFLEK